MHSQISTFAVSIAAATLTFSAGLNAQAGVSTTSANLSDLSRRLDSVQTELARYKASDREIRQLLGDVNRQLAALTSRMNTASGVPTPSGDFVIPNGRLCIGGPCVRGDEQIQILARRDAEILFQSNMNGRDAQGAAMHTSVLSAAADGGFRMIQNYRNIGAGVWPELSRPRTIWAFDSEGTPSLSQDYEGQIFPSQSFVIQFDRANQRIFLASMKPGWTWGFRTSTATNMFDRQWVVPISDPAPPPP
ncbi:MAG TPA: hypothetical protein VM939_08870 [Gemmatimonadaceae bacterium]|nr:hypothetical protein [Gemmatimonadaceae bacterium]